MVRRILVCMEELGVAQVVAARLLRDGAQAVVVEKPGDLIDHAESSVDAVLVQDRYKTGEIGASLLRQLRTTRGDAVPAVLVTHDVLSAMDRQVFEKQYKVRDVFLLTTSPLDLALALGRIVGPVEPTLGDFSSDFDISVLSVPNARVPVQLPDLSEPGTISDGAIARQPAGADEPRGAVDTSEGADEGDGNDAGDVDEFSGKTIEVSVKLLEELRASMPRTGNVNLSANNGAGEVEAFGLDGGTEAGMSERADVSALPAPGGDDDFVLPASPEEPSPPQVHAQPVDVQPLDLQPLDAPTLAMNIADVLAPSVPPFETHTIEVHAPPLHAPDLVKAVVDLLPELSTDRPSEPRSDVKSRAPPPLARAQAARSGIKPSESVRGTPIETLLAPKQTPSAEPAPATPTTSPVPTEPTSSEGDPVTTQEAAQKTQMELKKLLLAEREAHKSTKKRVDELEAQMKAAREPGARSAQTTTGVPTDGVFEDVRYPALLARCRAEAFTGGVHMQAGGVTRTVYLKDGVPVAYSSSEPGERIGKVLVTQKRITDEQYMKAATRMVERSIKLTDALVELNLIDAEALAVEQRNLTRDQIIAGFELVQGRFTVTAGQLPDANTPTFDFGPGEIYVQGYRRYAPSTEMLASYETARDKYLIANGRLAAYRPKLGLSGDDERLLRLLGEAFTVEEAVERAKVEPEQAARLLAALQALELVEEWAPGVEQFRTRLRAERQRHAEELAAVRAESQKRQDRLAETFERALAKLDGKSEPKAEGATADAASDEKKPSAGALSFLVGSAAGAAKAKEREVVKDDDKKAAPPPPKSTNRQATQLAYSPVLSPTPPPQPAPSSSPGGGPSFGASPLLATTLTIAAPSAPDSGPVSASDAKFKEGVLLATQGKLDEAESVLREAVRLDASRPDYLASLARVLLGNPRYERGGTLPVVKSLLDRALQLAPDNNEARDMQEQVVKEMASL